MSDCSWWLQVVLAAGDSQSLAGLQLYGVLAHSSMAGLLLMTGTAASHKRLLRGLLRSTSPAQLPPKWMQNVLRMRSRLTLQKKAGKSLNSVNPMSTAPLTCYRSGYLLEPKEDNSHRRQQETDLVFLKLVSSKFATVTNSLTGNRHWWHWSHPILFLISRDSSREPFTTSKKAQVLLLPT